MTKDEQISQLRNEVYNLKQSAGYDRERLIVLNKRCAQYHEKLKNIADLMEAWNRTTYSGGWSTHLVTPITNAVNDIWQLIGRIK